MRTADPYVSRPTSRREAVRKIVISIAVLAASATLVACGGSSSSSDSGGSGGGGSSSTAPVTLTLWHNYGTEQNAVATKNLVTAYEKIHPNVTIKIVSQPADNYFALLKAAAISHTGPDIAVQWTGLFTLQNKSYLQPLNGLVPQASLDKMKGMQWMSDGLTSSGDPYVMPLEDQFYIGFYNKKAFKDAGVASVPTDWSELNSACTKLKAAGYTPLVYGNGGQSLGTEFYPWYDSSYLMIGQYTVDQWKGLYDGSIPWNSPANEAQYQKWADLEKSGCTNDNVLTTTNNIEQFTSGKAAMIVDGTWDTQKYTDAMHNNVAAFVPPFSNNPIKGVVEYPGDGFSIMNYSQHQQDAADFLAFIATPAGVAAVNAAGLIPDVDGSMTTNPVNEQMLQFAASQGFTRYPMLDNVTQGDVVDTGNKFLPSVLANKTSASDALGQMNSTWQQLPEDQRGSQYK
jgi:ABC-type glycerol-3-phosphate transport system substrate-binding protein